jgi:hypothetical protein
MQPPPSRKQERKRLLRENPQPHQPPEPRPLDPPPYKPLGLKL